MGNLDQYVGTAIGVGIQSGAPDVSDLMIQTKWEIDLANRVKRRVGVKDGIVRETVRLTQREIEKLKAKAGPQSASSQVETEWRYNLKDRMKERVRKSDGQVIELRRIKPEEFERLKAEGYSDAPHAAQEEGDAMERNSEIIVPEDSRLTVIEIRGSMLLVECACGARVEKQKYHVVKGFVKSCGARCPLGKPGSAKSRDIIPSENQAAKQPQDIPENIPETIAESAEVTETAIALSEPVPPPATVVPVDRIVEQNAARDLRSTGETIISLSRIALQVSLDEARAVADELRRLRDAHRQSAIYTARASEIERDLAAIESFCEFRERLEVIA